MTDQAVPPQVLQLIDASGNTFHARVARWFKSAGWHVRVSPYYLDRTQDKAREIDLIVEKAIEIRDFANRYEGDIVVRLFVECKYVAGHSVFWFAEKDMASAEKLVVASPPFRADHTYTRKHHYLAAKDRVAKVFASDSSRSVESEWVYKALNQVLSAQTSMAEQPSAFLEQQKYTSTKIILNFPVIICSSFDKVFQTDFFEPSAPSRVTENFQIEVLYAYANKAGEAKDGYFLIDVVEFSQLEALAAGITSDGDVAAFLASSH